LEKYFDGGDVTIQDKEPVQMKLRDLLDGRGNCGTEELLEVYVGSFETRTASSQSTNFLNFPFY